MAEMRDTEEGRQPIELTPEEARHDAPPPRPAPGSRRTPGTLILIYGASLALIALAVWGFLLVVR